MTKRLRQLNNKWIVVLLLLVTPVAAQAFIYNAVAGMGSWLMTFSGGWLDGALYFFVFKMGDLYINSLGVIVENLWKFVRDIFNIAFIFGLIYIGFKTILNADDSNTRRSLILLLGAALLINFSLFITKAVVDFSNLAAYELRQLIEITPPKNTDGTSNNSQLVISGAFVAATKINSFTGANPAQIVSDTDGDTGPAWIVILGTLIFTVVTSFVFLSGAVLLTVRFIALLILMVLSPVMFLGWIVPSLQSTSSKYWQTFLSYAFYAPAYVFMLLLALRFIQQLNQSELVAGTSFADLITAGETFDRSAALVAVFAVSCGLMLAANTVASKMGIAGSNTVMKVGSGARKWTQERMKGAGNAAWGALKYDHEYRQGRRAEARVKKLDELDARVARGGRLGKLAAIQRAALVATSGNVNVRGARSAAEKRFKASPYSEHEADNKERARRVSTANATIEAQEAITLGASPNSTPDQRIAMEEAVSKLDVKELEAMVKTKKGKEALVSIAGSIPQSVFDKLVESEELSPTQRKELEQGRQKSIKKNLVNSAYESALEKTQDQDEKRQLKALTAAARKAKFFSEGIKSASSDQLDNLDFTKDVLPNALYLQSGQMDDLKKKWGEEKYRILKEEQKRLMVNSPLDALKSRKGTKEKAKLPSEVLMNDEVIDELFGTIAGPKEFDAELMNQIGQESDVDKVTFGRKVLNRYNVANDLNAPGTPASVKQFFKNPQGIRFLPREVSA